MTKTVSIQDVMGLIRAQVSGTSMVTVDLDSPMDGKGKMLKTGNPYVGKGIVKRETLNGTIGYIYSNAVNRIADKEGKETREAKLHPWGDMDEKHLFRIHRRTGKAYLSMQVKNVTVHGFFDPDNNEIPAESIRPFIPKKSKSSTQSDLDKEVIARDYGMENVRSIKAFGHTYQIVEVVTEQERERTKILTPAPVTNAGVDRQEEGRHVR